MLSTKFPTSKISIEGEQIYESVTSGLIGSLRMLIRSLKLGANIVTASHNVRYEIDRLIHK